ncbi:Aegerolysin [Penicillium cf. griseofulvum]|uniref:Aegerolysin n=1 Tax=Penicillium cf. griseofulvum TaxID=2972120 RepID=A0A9W9MFV6_9EURO|nr:Aegerolysin [Penicillium cf. griseofulvum]KAJ5442183.1 Aegerolysin [Penicillium cf. griseofulvum]KAJ5450844.1 Aegerolysin [Penicillium cf. griseofulvum]
MDIEMAQKYIQIQIQDDLKFDIRIENAGLESGKFYSAEDQNEILTSDDVNDVVIRHNGGIRSICAMDASEGSIDLVDDVRDKKICDLTWRASTQLEDRNEMMKLHQDPAYIVDVGNWNECGNMGWIPVTVKEQD